MPSNGHLQAPTDADQTALNRVRACQPVLVGIETAGAAMGLADGALGHAGPPFERRADIPPTVLNGLAGACVHEGWAGDLETARRLVLDGEVTLHANHNLCTVSPMAGVVRPSQAVMRVADANGTASTFATCAEPGRRALRFGVYDNATAAGLRTVETEIAPAIAAALPKGGLPVWPLVAQGLQLGDDTHQRNVGGMAALLGALPNLPGDVRTWLWRAPQHFLNYAMAAAKLCLDQAAGVRGSTLVTALSRNGVDCAVRVAGTGDTWYRTPASLPVGGFFDGYSLADAQPDLGDSAIVEAFGLGGCTAHTAPEIARTMQADWAAAQRVGREMRALFLDRQPAFDPAAAAPEGLGLGLCAARAAAAGGVRIHTGIAHAPGTDGWIGIGIAHAPAECFAAAAQGVCDSFAADADPTPEARAEGADA
jgi:hypothetical protein